MRVIVATLLIAGGVIYLARQQVNIRVRQQIAMRDARVLHALWLGQLENDPAFEILPPTDNPADLLPLLLDASRFRQFRAVIKATRLFDRAGKFVTAEPIDVPASALAASDFERVRGLEPMARFWEEVAPFSLSALEETSSTAKRGPHLEVLIPIHAPGKNELLGVAQFFLGGQSMANEFADLARTLTYQSLVAFCTVGTIQSVLLVIAFRQLEGFNRLLAERSRKLAVANRELLLAAKTAAIGAVSAHLIHGLKNPLSGLQSFVADFSATPGKDRAEDWESVVVTTRRMQSLVNDMVRVLREEVGEGQYELSVEEILDVIQARVTAAVSRSGVAFQCRSQSNLQFTNRDANLILLILENLITNAIQATAPDRAVRLAVSATTEAVHWEVCDEGSGVPPSVARQLFQPCQSSKEGGSGIGLAISLQLAKVLEGNLVLQSTGESGSAFLLTVPRERCVSSAASAMPRVI